MGGFVFLSILFILAFQNTWYYLSHHRRSFMIMKYSLDFVFLMFIKVYSFIPKITMTATDTPNAFDILAQAKLNMKLA